MRRELQSVGQEIHDQLLAAEHSHDAALAQSANLLSRLLQAKLQLRISAVSAAPVIAELGSAISAGIAKGASLSAVHGLLADLHQQTPLRGLHFGGGDIKANVVGAITGGASHAALPSQAA